MDEVRDVPAVKVLPPQEVKASEMERAFNAFVVAQGDVPQNFTPVRPSAPIR